MRIIILLIALLALSACAQRGAYDPRLVYMGQALMGVSQSVPPPRHVQCIRVGRAIECW